MKVNLEDTTLSISKFNDTYGLLFNIQAGSDMKNPEGEAKTTAVLTNRDGEKTIPS